jgi:hypothetical protein
VFVTFDSVKIFQKPKSDKKSFNYSALQNAVGTAVLNVCFSLSVLLSVQTEDFDQDLILGTYFS